MTRTVPDHQLSNETTTNSAPGQWSRCTSMTGPWALRLLAERVGARLAEDPATIGWRQNLPLPTPERVLLDSQVEAA